MQICVFLKKQLLGIWEITMLLRILLNTWLYIFILNTCVALEDKYSSFSVHHNVQPLISGSTKSFKAKTRLNCAMFCESDKDCTMAAFDTIDDECFLYKNSDFELTTKQNWDVVYKFGCQYKWRGHCYLISYIWDEFKNFTDAQKKCQLMGGNLVKIDDPEDNAWIVSTLQSLLQIGVHVEIIWIGANKIGQDIGRWVWLSDNSLMIYNDWASGEPSYSNGYSLEECVDILYREQYPGKKFFWNDNDCQLKFFFMCEK